MKFNINDYKGDYVMHCKDEEEAKEFVDYMTSIGKPLTASLPCYFGKNVCFFNDRTWASKDFAIKEGYIILEWSDFMNKIFTKANLKTGDVIQRRNGSVEIVNRELGTLICQRGWNDLCGVKEDLTDVTDSRFDIVLVRRPRSKGDCQFAAIMEDYGELVYERKEVEEMTLAEVCRLLGREIKIVR